MHVMLELDKTQARYYTLSMDFIPEVGTVVRICHNNIVAESWVVTGPASIEIDVTEYPLPAYPAPIPVCGSAVIIPVSRVQT